MLNVDHVADDIGRRPKSPKSGDNSKVQLKLPLGGKLSTARFDVRPFLLVLAKVVGRLGLLLAGIAVCTVGWGLLGLAGVRSLAGALVLGGTEVLSEVVLRFAVEVAVLAPEFLALGLADVAAGGEVDRQLLRVGEGESTKLAFVPLLFKVTSRPDRSSDLIGCIHLVLTIAFNGSCYLLEFLLAEQELGLRHAFDEGTVGIEAAVPEHA